MIYRFMIRWFVMVVGCLASAVYAGDDALSIDLEAAQAKSHRIIRVTTAGADGVNCGSKQSPCRSLSQAITNASDHDTILVGPGRYADLDLDAVPEYNEESGMVGTGCECLIYVAKRLNIISEKGAASTHLDAYTYTELGYGYSGALYGVVIATDHVTFGKPGHGFTVTGANIAMMLGESSRESVVSGNILSNYFTYGLEDHGVKNLISANLSIGYRAIYDSSAAFEIFGQDTTLRSNYAIGGRTGFFVYGSGHVLEENSAIGASTGFEIWDGNIRLSRNAVIGNKSSGIWIRAGTVQIEQNNIFGNDLLTRTAENCGLSVRSGQVTAKYNWWGAATGPGSDPADSVCDNSGNGTGVAVTYPFSKQPIRQAEPPVRW